MLDVKYWQMQQTVALDPVLQAVVSAVVAQSLTAAGVRAELATELARIDTPTSTRLASASYTAPDNAGVSAIQSVTDSFNFTVPGKVDTNTMCIKGTYLTGEGTSENPWRPA